MSRQTGEDLALGALGAVALTAPVGEFTAELGAASNKTVSNITEAIGKAAGNDKLAVKGRCKKAKDMRKT